MKPLRAGDLLGIEPGGVDPVIEGDRRWVVGEGGIYEPRVEEDEDAEKDRRHPDGGIAREVETGPLQEAAEETERLEDTDHEERRQEDERDLIQARRVKGAREEGQDDAGGGEREVDERECEIFTVD
ncbi:hypothetical protein DSECCO2_602790 [anaerobic digester metagenome]